METAEQLVVWEKTRDTVEAFEKGLENIRRFYLALVGTTATFIGATILTFQESYGEFAVLTLMYLSALTIVGVSSILWILDCRRHQYLRICAKIARRLEERLDLKKDHLGVSVRLQEFVDFSETKMDRCAIKLRSLIYHLVYLAPSVGAASAVIFIDWRGNRLVVDSISSMFIVLYLIVIASAITAVIVSSRRYKNFDKTW